MQQEVAETVARATREEAEQRANDDLDQLRRQAVEAGRERSRKIIKITNIDPGTGAISYNPAGRLLRDWMTLAPRTIQRAGARIRWR